MENADILRTRSVIAGGGKEQRENIKTAISEAKHIAKVDGQHNMVIEGMTSVSIALIEPEVLDTVDVGDFVDIGEARGKVAFLDHGFDDMIHFFDRYGQVPPESLMNNNSEL